MIFSVFVVSSMCVCVYVCNEDQPIGHAYEDALNNELAENYAVEAVLYSLLTLLMLRLFSLKA